MIDKSTRTSSYRLWSVVLGVVLLGLSGYAGLTMLEREVSLQLWGHWPLLLLGGGYLGMSMLFLAARRRAHESYIRYGRSTLIGILMAMSFPDLPCLPLVWLAWVLFYHELRSPGEATLGQQWRRWYHVFIVWNIISTFWISNTAFAAGIVAIMTNALLMTLPILLFQRTRHNLAERWQFPLFIACWIAFEYLHFRWEAHWPWLTIGHYFMEVPWAVQWYSYTGVLGGSLWVLASVGALYALWQQGFHPRRVVHLGLVLIVPLLISWYLSHEKLDIIGQHDIIVVQPNQEPHYVKGRKGPIHDMNLMIAIADSLMDESVDVVVTPETGFDVRLNRWTTSTSIQHLHRYAERYPQVEFLMGMGSSRVLEDGDEQDRFTRTYVSKRGDTIYWENHNAALLFRDMEDFDIYYKSKLVPGAEFFPFKDVLFIIKPLVDKLGGSASGLRMQERRVAFDLHDGGKAAPVICYESVFGDYVSGYIEEGAEWLAVVTNDGWWDETAGHKQHLGLSVLRAIEQRRWIARSANSGISCFIDPYGHIHQATAYDTTRGIRRTIDRITTRTWYSVMGDQIGRIALSLVILCLGYVMAKYVRRRV